MNLSITVLPNISISGSKSTEIYDENLVSMLPSFMDDLSQKLTTNPGSLSKIELMFLNEKMGQKCLHNLDKEKLGKNINLPFFYPLQEMNNLDLSSVKVLFVNIDNENDTKEFRSITFAAKCSEIRSTKLQTIIKNGKTVLYQDKKWYVKRK